MSFRHLAYRQTRIYSTETALVKMYSDLISTLDSDSNNQAVLAVLAYRVITDGHLYFHYTNITGWLA